MSNDSNEVILTPEGFKLLEEKLEILKVHKRKEMAEKIKIAREFGDISENAEYDAAKEEQAMVEGEIIDIENKLRTAKIIDSRRIDTSIVSLGCTIKLFDIEFNETSEYKLVGTTESDPLAKRISNESPVGKAILGKKKGDTVEVAAPAGIVKMKILDIRDK
jgi:transcription elongation factor GreA